MAKQRASVKKTERKPRHKLPPGPGRPKGVPNKATQEIRKICQNLLDAKYYESLRRRLLEHRVPPAIVALLHHYAWGVPKKTVALEQGETPVIFTLKIDDASDSDL